MAGFEKAKKEQVWLKVLLTGASGCGKSYSALRLATGIEKECGGDIAYIGTEGSRDKYYSNEFDYDLLQLDEPYTPESYMSAIDEAVSAGYKVLIIDSLTQEWTFLNDTHNSMGGNSFTNWNKLKPRHSKFIEKILMSPIHVIATARGKDEWVLEEEKGKQVPKKVGMGAQQDKDISYEFTVSLQIAQDTHIATADKDNTHIFNDKYEVLTEADGEKLYEWANDGEKPTEKPKQSFTDSAMSDEDMLKSVKKDIISLCNDLGGTKNEALMTTLKEYVPSGNPNALKNLDKAKECLEKIKGVKPL